MKANISLERLFRSLIVGHGYAVATSGLFSVARNPSLTSDHKASLCFNHKIAHYQKVRSISHCSVIEKHTNINKPIGTKKAKKQLKEKHAIGVGAKGISRLEKCSGKRVEIAEKLLAIEERKHTMELFSMPGTDPKLCDRVIKIMQAKALESLRQSSRSAIEEKPFIHSSSDDCTIDLTSDVHAFDAESQVQEPEEKNADDGKAVQNRIRIQDLI